MQSQQKHRPCRIEGCPKKHKGRGYCEMHLARLNRTGKLTVKEPTLVCIISGCGKAHCARQYCQKHYWRFLRNQDPYRIKKPHKWFSGCIFKKCNRAVKGHGYCTLHYQRFKKYGDPSVCKNVVRIGKSQSYIKNGIGYIELTRGQWAMVDEEDFHGLDVNKWQCNNHGYAYRVAYENKKKKGVLMHHEIFGKPPNGMVTDHANRNRLDNRKANLQFVTQSQNLTNRGAPANNTSGYKGVCKETGTNRWKASITIQGKTHNLGVFDSKIQAASAYRSAAVKFGFYFIPSIL